jgi:hypothetical protein
MSLLRSALILILALGSTQVLAEQITCESHGGRAEACGTVQPGSSVTLLEQISSSPCIEGSTWGADNDSIWVSGGCRGVFDVQPRYSSTSDNSYYDDDRPYDNNDRVYERTERTRYYGSRYASDDSGRRVANNACLVRISTDQPFDASEIGTNDIRRVSDDLFVVDVNTPKGPMSCTVDRLGNVRSLDINYR